jgi:anti-adapter protein IraM
MCQKSSIFTQQNSNIASKEDFMEWKVVETIASPESGTIFCKVETQYGLNYILWLKGDYYVRTGEIITTSNQGILINDRRRRVWIAQAMPFTSIGWMGFIQKNACPGNRQEMDRPCTAEPPCQFKLCPFGLKRYIPERYSTAKNNIQPDGRL